MNRRPTSITIISWVFITAGVVGLLYHLSEFKTQSFAYGLVWACSVRSLAIPGGVFMLYGFDWARWLLVFWIAYHVVLSAFHSLFEIVFHTALLGVVAYFLFRLQASAYFQRRKAARHQNPTDQLWPEQAEVDMWILIRAVTYSALFIGFLLVFLPARVLSWSGITPAPSIGVWQVCGMISAGVGAALALWCIMTFVFLGKGTPAPFDPPRRLVVRGPYRIVRNPMYLGAGLALAGAALVYKSVPLLTYAGLFWLIMHGFVVWYEEPTLRRTFTNEYEVYCKGVGRWWPKL